MMIEPTRDDIGRMVRMTAAPYLIGKLVKVEPCSRQCPYRRCCSVKYDSGTWSVDADRLAWSDDTLL